MSTGILATGGAIASATPYPWPYHGNFSPQSCALVACVDPSWRRDGTATDNTDQRLDSIATALRSAGGTVIAIVTMPRRAYLVDANELEPASADTQLLAADLTVRAAATNAFYATDLDATLRARGIQDILLAGWGLEGPVHSTMRAANDRGFECLLISDASCPIEDELSDAACSMIQFSGGIFGTWATSDVVLALLRQFALPPSITTAEHTV